MAGVNDWRFRLAEEEDRRRRKFGWDDLLGLLQTAAGIGTSIAGLKQSGERQALAQEQFDYGKEQDVLAETARVGRETRGLEDEGYKQVETPPLTGSPGSMAGYAAATQGTTSYPDIPNQYFTPPQPEPEPTWPEPPPVQGSALTWQDPESGRPYYTREHPPDVEGAGGGLFEVPGTGQEIPKDSQQYRQFVLEMWREQNRGKDIWGAAAERFESIYGGYPPKDMDPRAEMGLIAAEISAMSTLEALAPEDVLVDVLMAGSDINALEALGASWAGQNGEPAVTEVIATLIEIIQKRATGR